MKKIIQEAILLGVGSLVVLGTLSLVSCEDLGLGDSDGDPTGDAGMVTNDAGTVAASFTALYNDSAFQMCAGCHAPDALGITDGTEATQDWSSRDAAYASLQGVASGLTGNSSDCNDVPFLGTTPETSLLVAVLDETVRANFMLAEFPACNVDTITDETLPDRVGPVSAATMTALRAWINAGAPDN